ncbi:MAG: TAT-variant-translocated molybdopterin oxidoreductase [Gemmataceae bacterium]
MHCHDESDLDEVRTHLASKQGPEYWRALDELAQTPAFQALVEREFKQPIGDWTTPLSRRRFLSLLGASFALAGLSGCGGAPREPIMPYVRPPEEIVPGRPLFFATAMPLAGYASGLLVKSHMGRPTKIEGNPEHPANLMPAGAPPEAKYGPTDLYAQAELLSFYDPDRSRAVTHLGEIRSWDAFVADLQRVLRNGRDTGVDTNLRIRILTGAITSPALADQIQKVLDMYPRARWHVWEPAGQDNARIGARFAFGRDLATRYRFDEAKVVLSLDADFLGQGPGSVRYTRDFTARRRVRLSRPEQTMNRLYAVESTPTITGAAADHRLPQRAAQIESLARDIARRVGVSVPDGAGPAHDVPATWLDAVVADLRREPRSSLVVAGAHQPPLVHALVHAINMRLGNRGHTVLYSEPIERRPIRPSDHGPETDPVESLRELADAMSEGIDLLLVLGSNPAYTAPADLRFAERLEHVPFVVHLGLYADETADLAHWRLPETHFLESWGDTRAYDGTVSFVQPLIEPLYAGRSEYDILAILTSQLERSAYEVVRRYWRERFLRMTRPTPSNFEAWWRKALHDGFVADSGAPAVTPELAAGWAAAPGVRAATGLEVNFRLDPTLFDGRFANNGWLQELPKPLTKLTWDNAILISPATAVRLGFARDGHPEEANEKVARLELRGRHVEGPLWVLPGHADDSVTVYVGNGRSSAGHVGTNVGFNAYALRTSEALGFDTGATLTTTGRRHRLACSQLHNLMHNRDIIRSGTLSRPPTIPEPAHTPRRTLSLYPEPEYLEHKWGMTIDLTLCTGCSACVVACQAENNIPVVGKDQVLAGREMHWLRVDQYYVGGAEQPAHLFHQPVACMHCENAPCEVVCPVMATAHSSDGLNDMVYNRCVGTRYCSNNCPYKVRRFNFFQYADMTTESLRLMYNPEVTVRTRGVMEKCTYCVQRIRTHQIHAQVEERPLGDGEIMTACQAACPAGAIVFGDLNARSKVAQEQLEPLSYGLLYDLNTRPRTTYLAALKNPNPDILRVEEVAR